MEASFLAIPLDNSKFRSFLMLAKKYGMNEKAFTTSLQGLSIYNRHKKAKITSWVEVVAVPHIFL